MRTQKLDRATTFWIVTIECVSKLSLAGSLFVLMFLFIIDFSCAQPKVKIFDKESGLSSNDVVSIVQDQAGYLWVGTKNGLNRFDGNTFKVFKYSSQNENSLFSNFIRCLAVDRLNRIWIGH